MNPCPSTVSGKGRAKGDKARGKSKGPRAHPRRDESEEEDPWSRYAPVKGASGKGKDRPKGRDPWLDRSGWESGWGYPYPEAYPARSKGGYYEEHPEPWHGYAPWGRGPSGSRASEATSSSSARP